MNCAGEPAATGIMAESVAAGWEVFPRESTRCKDRIHLSRIVTDNRRSSVAVPMTVPERADSSLAYLLEKVNGGLAVALLQCIP